MSIAIGFQCTDGIVLAADSEISNSFVKLPGDKAWIYKYPPAADRFTLQIGIVGAGDASFIQYASERINDALEEKFEKQQRMTMPAVKAVIQGVINDLHYSHIFPVPAHHPEPPSVELIIGVWLGDTRLRLTKTYLTSITKVWNYEAVGVGSALANFIIKRFYSGRVTMSQAVFIASQVLMHVKANVPRCGGASKVIMMFKRGDVGWAQEQTIADHEVFLTKFDDVIAPVFFGGSDKGVSNVEFHGLVDELSKGLKSLRKVEAIQDLNVQLREDVKIAIPPGTISMVGLTGVSATGHVGSLTPSVTPSPDARSAGRTRVKKPARPVPKRGRKSRPASQG
jgi:20S proteasome alpha/beta subunit